MDDAGARHYIMLQLTQRLPPDLPYHGLHHTRDDVLPAAERLAALAGVNGEDLILLRTAALYHDAGYMEQYLQNEAVGARIAAESLPAFGYTPSQVRAVQDMIMATQLPQTPRSFLAELLCDADLDSLGREDYLETSHNLRAELAAHGVETTLETWYERQLRLLTGHTYFTAVARSLRDDGKRANAADLQQRLASLRSG